MNTVSQEIVEAEVTTLFRQLLRRYNTTTNPENYEFVDGELWCSGIPMVSGITESESRCLEHAIGETLNRRMCTGNSL